MSNEHSTEEARDALREVVKRIEMQESCASPAGECYSDHKGCYIHESLKIAREVLARFEPPRNPYLPERPADGKHDFGTPEGYRCRLCGVYNRPQPENPPFYQPCQGEYAESGKMRAWADEKWSEDPRFRPAEDTP